MGPVHPLFVLVIVQAWDYVSDGSNWAEGMCSNPASQRQSPINLPAFPTAGSDHFFYTYPLFQEPLRLYATEHTVAVTFPENYKAGFAHVESVTGIQTGAAGLFRLRQMSMHAPGEHRYNGEQPRVELQLMHEQGFNLGGLAVSFIQGPSSPLLAQMLENLPSSPGQEAIGNLQANLDLASIVKGAELDSYEGSLTVPPCDQTVHWFVRSQPLTASQDQLRAIEQVIQRLSPPHGNSRQVQEIHDRVVTRVNTQDFDGESVAAEVEAVVVHAPPAEEVPLIPPTDVLNNPAFQMVFADDTLEMRKAKSELATSSQEAQGSRVAAIQAKQFLDTQQDLYDSTTGLVGKMNLMWPLLAAKSGYQGAVAHRESCNLKYQAAIKNVVALVSDILEQQAAAGGTSATQQSLSEATQEALKLASQADAAAMGSQNVLDQFGDAPEIAEARVQPTAMPVEEGENGYWKMEYGAAHVVPLQDEASNPFQPGVAERVARIGGTPGQMIGGYRKIAASLRTPEGSGGVVPNAMLRYRSCEHDPAGCLTYGLITTTPVPTNATNSTNTTGVATSFVHPKLRATIRQDTTRQLTTAERKLRPTGGGWFF